MKLPFRRVSRDRGHLAERVYRASQNRGHLASEKVVALQSEADNLHQTLLSKIPEGDKPVLQSILERDTIETRGKMSAVKEKKLQRLRAEKQTLESMPVRTEVPENVDSSSDDNHLKPASKDAHEIFNLSTRKLTEAETSVLKKGLNFVPTRKQPLAQVISELKEWERLMRLHEYWATSDTCLDGNEDPDRRYKKSKWTPPKGRDPCLDLYIDEITRDIIRSMRRAGTRNMTTEEGEALQDLMKDDEIVIRPADKGSGVVIIDKKDYMEKLENELSDTSTYQLVEKDITSQVQKEVKSVANACTERGMLEKTS